MQVLVVQLLTSRDHFWSRIPRPKMVSGSEQLGRKNLHKFITSRNHFWSRISRPEMVSVKGKFEHDFDSPDQLCCTRGFAHMVSILFYFGSRVSSDAAKIHPATH